MQIKCCSDFSVSADSQGPVWVITAAAAFLYESVSVEIYLFLQAVSSEEHLYWATGSLFFF